MIFLWERNFKQLISLLCSVPVYEILLTYVVILFYHSEIITEIVVLHFPKKYSVGWLEWIAGLGLSHRRLKFSSVSVLLSNSNCLLKGIVFFITITGECLFMYVNDSHRYEHMLWIYLNISITYSQTIYFFSTTYSILQYNMVKIRERLWSNLVIKIKQSFYTQCLNSNWNKTTNFL